MCSVMFLFKFDTISAIWYQEKIMQHKFNR